MPINWETATEEEKDKYSERREKRVWKSWRFKYGFHTRRPNKGKRFYERTQEFKIMFDLHFMREGLESNRLNFFKLGHSIFKQRSKSYKEYVDLMFEYMQWGSPVVTRFLAKELGMGATPRVKGINCRGIRRLVGKYLKYK
jgi:hypothetical protein